ncbi:MAG TPA: protease pro-enzyme activation domain-containing protein [Candidatus Binataceae bacterium]|nr:protease pro-enzyme activation domain-containing protein [Candidatus Binataceae bacterium]
MVAIQIAGAASDTAVYAAARTLTTSKIDGSATVALAGNVRPEANWRNDRGRVPDSLPFEHLMLQLRRSPRQERALEKLLGELNDPHAPNYHHWLSASEFGRRYGLAAADLAHIQTWLKSYGFAVNRVYPNRTLVDFSGTASQIRHAFGTEIHYLDVNGARHLANMTDPRIPAALAPAISGVISLHDFFPRPAGLFTRPAVRPADTYDSSFQYVAPGDLATVYNLKPLFAAGYSGQGQTIVMAESSDLYSARDWSNFRSAFKLSSAYPNGSLKQIHPAPASGRNNCSDPGVVSSGEAEAIADAEWASAAAPNAALVMASCADSSTSGVFIALVNVINSAGTPPGVISVSFGSDEADMGSANQAIFDAYQQAASEGISVFVAAGDQGAAMADYGASAATHGIAVSGWASTPYNVAVGGTDFGDTYAGTNSTYWGSSDNSDFSSAQSYVPEIPWNDTCGSSLIASANNFSSAYGSNGFCDSSAGQAFLNSGLAAGGGGPSGCASGSPSASGVVSGSCTGYAKPQWQTVPGNPNDGVRDLPDVALFAGLGPTFNGVSYWGHAYEFCFSDTNNGGASCAGSPPWLGLGGTSVAAPVMAGIQSLINQKIGAHQGNPNPSYYALASSEYGSNGSSQCNSSLGNKVDSGCIFYDVTQGDIDVNCTGSYDCYLPSGTNGVLSTSVNSFQSAYRTTSGWDFASGIGTVNAYNLAVAMSSPSPTTTATPSATPTPSPTPSPTATPSPTPSPTVTPSPSPTPTPTATQTPSPTPTPTPSPSPTLSPTPSPTPTSTATPTPTASPTPSPTITPTPTPIPSPTPTALPATSGAISVAPASLHFPATGVGGRPSILKVRIKNSGKGLLLGSAQISGGSPYQMLAGGAGFRVGAKKSYVLRIQFRPAAVGNAAPANLIIVSSDPRHGTVEIPMSGAGAGGTIAVRLRGDGMQYPNTPIGHTVARSFAIANTGEGMLHVSLGGMDNNGPAMFAFAAGTETSFELAPKSKPHLVTLLFAPSASGHFYADFMIVNDDPNPVRETIPVTLSGVGD